ncbi:MAG: NfeD family protein [Bacillota bacterium]
MRRRMLRLLFALALVLAAGLMAPLLAPPAVAAPEAEASFLAFRVTGEINPGLAAMLDRAVARAEAGAPEVRALVLVIDTPGGLVAAAERMRDALLRTRVPTLAYVEGHATSAGALVALAAQHLYMAPGSTIGDAEPIPYSDKAVSYVRGLFEATAEARGRDVRVAAAMVDKKVEIPGVTTGLPLNLRYSQAVELGIADGVAENLTEALRAAGLGEGEVVWYRPTASERAARFLTQSWVASLLLLIALGALALEMATPGVGLPGAVGVGALVVFFGSHLLVGTANWLEIGLVILGILLLVVEVFVPGFGIFGIAGLAALAAGIFLIAPDARTAALYLAVAAFGFLALLLAFFRFLSRRGFIPWLTLERRLDREAGFVAPRAASADLVGARGEAVTPLRPAGVARLGDRRVDVVTEGEFLPAGTPVEVVAVDGTRVVVRALAPAAGDGEAPPGGGASAGGGAPPASGGGG